MVDRDRPASPRLDDNPSNEAMERLIEVSEDVPGFEPDTEPGSFIDAAAEDLPQPEPDPGTEQFDDARADVPHQP